MGIRDSALLRKLAAFVEVTDAELALLSEMGRKRRSFPPGRSLVEPGQQDQPFFILTEGWAFSYKLLADGTRQIVDFHVPGDFLGLRTVLLRRADYTVEPITPIEAVEVTAADVTALFHQMPRLALVLLWAAARDEALVIEHLVGIGRRNAAERTAHLLLELGARLRLVGLGTCEGYDCPLSQYVLADALGLSAVHVNRVLRHLREDRLLTFQKGHVTIHDVDRLGAMANFDAAYLDQDRPTFL